VLMCIRQIYSLSRFSALLSIILFFVTFDVTTPINCQLWMLFSILFLCLSSITASLLIVIRTIAIWNRNKVAVALAMIVLGISIGFHIQNLVLVRFKWISSEQSCQPARDDAGGLGFIPSTVADMVLLLIIFASLFVLRRNGGGTFGLTGLLWRQGVVWLVLGSAIEIPTLVFSLVHLNDQLHSLFEVPSLVVMTIAATRMHRSLVDFASGSTEVRHESRPLSSLVFSKTKRGDTALTTLDRMDASVNRAFEQRSTGSKNDGDSSTVFSTSEQIPRVTSDPPKLDLTQASAHPRPTVSPSPVLEAESV